MRESEREQAYSMNPCIMFDFGEIDLYQHCFRYTTSGSINI